MTGDDGDAPGAPGDDAPADGDDRPVGSGSPEEPGDRQRAFDGDPGETDPPGGDPSPGGPSGAVDVPAAPDDDEWRDLHPVTAGLNALQYGFNLGAAGFFLGSIAGGALDALPVGSVFVLAVGGFLVGAGYGVARYLAFEYRLGRSALHITSGVFSRQNREIPLRRVQNVDVHQSFVARVLGLAAVRFETAGGGQTEGEITLVSKDEAERLQRELRRRKRDAEATPDEVDAGETVAGRPASDERAAEGETVLFELSTRDLLVLSGVSFRTGVLFLLLFGIPLVSDAVLSVAIELLGEDPTPSDPLVVAVVVAGAFGFLLLAWLVSAAMTFVRYFDFRLARIDDELVYERGLLQRYSGSIPLDKVQALSVRENPLMRRLGYASLLVETAGYSPGANGSGAGDVPSAVPLADRASILRFAEELEGTGSLAVETPPARSRRRYAVRYALVVVALTAALFAVDRLWIGLPWYLELAALALAPLAGHLKWANRGFRLDEDHLVTRTGFWRRSTRIVPYYRIQTVVTERTVFQRRWSIATVVADTASSAGLFSRQPAAYDIDEDRARELHRSLRERLQGSLSAGRTADRRPTGRGRGGSAGADPSADDVDGAATPDDSEGGPADESDDE